MLARYRCHFTYANVMSTVAVFLALGGSSYAALNLPKASVGAKQLKKNSVSSPKVKPGSLLLSDFRRSQRARLRGPRGAPGPRGLPGPAGPAPSCPAGTVTHEFACIETAQRPQLTWVNARASCRAAGRRLPSLSELTTFEQRSDSFVPTVGSEWVDALSGANGMYLTMNNGLASSGPGMFSYRCVARGSFG
jgi:hypothetical protein